MTANPTLLSMPLAQNGQKNVIPETQATAGDGLFSQSTGFPAETSLPLGAGGVAPSREDFNGMANLLGGVAYYAQKGWIFQFDAGQEYFAGCIVRDTTDGKLYECINDVAAGGSVPSADAVNWKESGVDLSIVANTDLSNLTTTGENHFLEQDFAIIYPNGGSEGNPANVTTNSLYLTSNPFPGYYVACSAEIYYSDSWHEVALSNYFNLSAQDNQNCGMVIGQEYDGNIALRTGLIYIATSAGQYATTAVLPPTQISTVPCRIRVWKIGKIPS